MNLEYFKWLTEDYDIRIYNNIHRGVMFELTPTLDDFITPPEALDLEEFKVFLGCQLTERKLLWLRTARIATEEDRENLINEMIKIIEIEESLDRV